jgi:hypothetical protein
MWILTWWTHNILDRWKWIKYKEDMEFINKRSFKKKYIVILTRFVIFLYCSFAFGIETYNVKLTLSFSECFTSHKNKQETINIQIV